MNLKKNIVIVLICSLLLTVVAPFNTGIQAASKKTTASSTKNYKLVKKNTSIYFWTKDNSIKIPTYFVNGLEVPYLEIDDCIIILSAILYAQGYTDYEITSQKKGNNVVLTRENGFTCEIDFKNDQFHFYDYNLFLRKSQNDSVIDVVSFKEDDNYVKRVLDNSTERYGYQLTLSPGDYGIDLVRKGTKYLIPLQVFNDVFVWVYYQNIMYNGKDLFVMSSGGSNLIDDNYNLTELGELYYQDSLKKDNISQELALFNYNEICFALDHLYGLKENHNIKSFDDLMRNTGLMDMMLSGSTTVIELAMYTLTTRYLDDVHTNYDSPSPAAGYELREYFIDVFGEGPARDAMFSLSDEFKAVRKKYYPNGVPGYEEIGDTAYITFDEFYYDQTDYYSVKPTNDPSNTIGLIAYSVQQILRKNSPIKNVVLDLSCNLGGSVDAAVYALGAFLGKASISLENSNTGALVTTEYIVDTNLDHVFDDKDYLAGKGLNLYCLSSGVSFSCGNLITCMFKQSSDVSLIGQTSSGGACTLIKLSSAIGSTYNISSPNRISFLKNGAFYDVDRGADPDFYLSKKSSFYDREKLTKYIDSLM